MTKSNKIVITGAESTGKSTIAKVLANHYNTIWIPELAREYVETLNREYTYEDVEIIARRQIEIEQDLVLTNKFIFFDTWLIITKVWFDFLYQKHPKWLDDAIKNCNVDLFLICDIDMPWVKDPIRENGGDNRLILQKLYLAEIKKYGFEYRIVSGTDEIRIKNAIDIINNYFNFRHQLK